MVARRTEWTNAYNQRLQQQFRDSDTQMTLADTTLLQVPCYLVIDPESVTNREYVYVSAKAGNVLTVDERALAGSSQTTPVDHASDTTVLAVALAQGFTDLHDRVDTADAAITSHRHAEYVPRDGSAAMTGQLDMGGRPIVNLQDPAQPAEAASKSYVDTADAGIQAVYNPRFNAIETRLNTLTFGDLAGQNPLP